MSDDRLEFLSTGELDFSDYDPEDLVTADIKLGQVQRPDGTTAYSLDNLTKDEDALQACLSEEQKQQREAFKEEESKARFSTMTDQLANLTTRQIGNRLGGPFLDRFASAFQPRLPPMATPNTLKVSDDDSHLRVGRYDPLAFETPDVELGPDPSIDLLNNVVDELRTQSKLSATQNAKLGALAVAQKDSSAAQEKHARFNRWATSITLGIAALTLGATVWNILVTNEAESEPPTMPAPTQERSDD